MSKGTKGTKPTVDKGYSSEKLYKILFEQAADGIFITDEAEVLLRPHHHGRDALNSPVWRSNLRLLERYRLSFDLFVRPDQAASAVDVLDSTPGVLFILGHAGMPDRREDADLSRWRRALQLLSRCPNLVVKISGLGMFDRAWTVDRIRPIVLDTIDAFGPERCMFGSNFPVDRMMSSYARLWEAFARSTEGSSPRERALLFHDNAVRYYRL